MFYSNLIQNDFFYMYEESIFCAIPHGESAKTLYTKHGLVMDHERHANEIVVMHTWTVITFLLVVIDAKVVAGREMQNGISLSVLRPRAGQWVRHFD